MYMLVQYMFFSIRLTVCVLCILSQTKDGLYDIEAMLNLFLMGLSCLSFF